MAAEQPITALLHGIREGDKASLDVLIPLVYSELHRLADRCLRRERSDHTLQPTALVHEAYVRMVGQDQPDYRDRAHFFGIASQVMRQILVDHARTRNAAKRGGGAAKLPFDEALSYSEERAADMLALDDALRALEELDPDKARMIEMRYFGGLTAEESGEILGIPAASVYRQVRMAQAWLERELTGGGEKLPKIFPAA